MIRQFSNAAKKTLQREMLAAVEASARPEASYASRVSFVLGWLIGSCTEPDSKEREELHRAIDAMRGGAS